MRGKQITKIESTLSRLLDGDLYTPVRIEGMGVYHATLKRLEELRVTLLKLEDSKLEIENKNNSAIAAVAHDLKTPLAVISGYAECITDGIDDKDYAHLILDKTRQMNDMVLSLVETSRQKLQEETSHKIAQNMQVYFNGVYQRLESITDQGRINFEMSKVPNVSVRLDPYQFGRALQNLVTNAVKYSPEGSTLRIFVKRRNKYLRIIVKDEGCGIAKEHLPYIFDQFYKVDASRTNVSSNGLGLYITKEIVTDHGGYINVHSKVGRGTTFVIGLPIERENQEKDFTARVDKLPTSAKIAISFWFGFCWGFIYRLARFFESRRLSTLFGATMAIWFMPFMWIFDFISTCAYKRLIFLAD